MPAAIPPSYRGVPAVLATMHAKEQVIAPILKEALGLQIAVPAGIDTDRFGTFSGEVPRIGTSLEAARAKIAAGFAAVPQTRIAIASEGSFGPHPHIPFLALGREWVVLVDRCTGLELVGFDATEDTNFGHVFARHPDEALAFVARLGFPRQGVIVLAARDEKPAPDLLVAKDITDLAAVEAAARQAIAVCGVALVQTDMRAHHNPTRMAAIGRATRDLVRLLESRCPTCAHPGFDITERTSGLPCAWCGEPTRVFVSTILTCKACGHQEVRPATSDARADPGQCDGCNP